MEKNDLTKPLERMDLTVRDTPRHVRIDRYLATRLPMYSREFFRRNITAGRVLFFGRPVRPGKKVVNRDEITIHLPPEVVNDLRPEDIPIEAAYEDEHMLAVNKAPGLAVHPAGKHLSNTVLNAVAYRYRHDRNVEPHLVHRLDKNTSGVLLFAKNLVMKQKLYRIFEKRSVQKEYVAIVSAPNAPPPASGLIDRPLLSDKTQSPHKIVVHPDGKPSQTAFRIIERLDDRHFILSLDLLTGRQHQIRAHLEFMGWPILGDERYSGEIGQIDRQALHARRISFEHPITGERIEITADLPPDMQRAANTFRENRAGSDKRLCLP